MAIQHTPRSTQTKLTDAENTLDKYVVPTGSAGCPLCQNKQAASSDGHPQAEVREFMYDCLRLLLLYLYFLHLEE